MLQRHAYDLLVADGDEIEGGVRAWIVGTASGFSGTFFGLIPICSISNRCLNGKQSAEKWAEQSAEYSAGPTHAYLFSLTKSVHFFLRAASLGNVCRDTPSVLVFPQFAATHLIPLPLLFPPRSPRGIFHMCLLSLLFKGWRHTPETTETSRYFRTEIKVNTPEQLSRVTLKIFRSRLLHSYMINYWFYIIY